MRNHLALAKYSKTVDKIAEGDVLTVETGKDKEGFVRVQRILDPGTATADKKTADASVPF